MRFYSTLLLLFHYFTMPVCPWISLESGGSFIWFMITNSSQCHSNPVLVTPSKPPDTVKDILYGQTYDLKIRVVIWMRMDVVPLEYGTFIQKFHLIIWSFWFITGITSKWDYVLWCIIVLLVWIDIWTKLRIYKVPPDPVKWSC